MARTTTRKTNGGGRLQRSPSTALAKPGDPLVTASGKVVHDNKKVADNKFDIHEAVSAETFRPSRRRTAKELPGPSNIINAVAAVFTYTMLGLSDREIADVLCVDVDRIVRTREHPAYSETFDIILAEFLSANSEILQGRIAAYGHSALSRVADLAMSNKIREDVVLRAAQDLLDRGGMRPQDVMGRRATAGNELRIVVIDNKTASVDISLNGQSLGDEEI